MLDDISRMHGNSGVQSSALTLGLIDFDKGFFLAASFRTRTHLRWVSVRSIPMLFSSSYYRRERIVLSRSCDQFVCPANQHPKSTIKKKAHKPSRTSLISQNMYLPCLIIIQSCYFDYRINKPFTCSRCMICVSCSVHLISTYHVRKGSWTFLS